MNQLSTRLADYSHEQQLMFAEDIASKGLALLCAADPQFGWEMRWVRPSARDLQC